MSGFMTGSPVVELPMYWSISTKGGDTLTNPTTETKFASQYPMPANILNVGDRLGCDFHGLYMVPGSLAPNATAKIWLGSTMLVSSGSLSVGIGTGVIYSFWGRMRGVVRSIGATGTMVTSAHMFFQSAGLPTPDTAGLGTTGTVTIDTTTAQSLALSVVSSNVTGQYFQIIDISFARLQNLSTNN